MNKGLEVGWFIASLGFSVGFFRLFRYIGRFSFLVFISWI